MVALFYGSVIKMCFIRSLENAGTNLGIWYSPAIIFLYKILVDGSSNGKYPHTRANNITPVLKIKINLNLKK